MGLFSLDQIEQINKAAEESTLLVQSKPSSKASSIMDTLNSISQEVLEYFKDSKAKLITNKQDLHNYVTRMIQAGIGGIDTETTGLDRINDTIVGASLYFKGEQEVYIPIKHIVPIFDVPYKNQLTYEEVGEEFQRLANGAVKLVFANADFDLAMIYKDLKVDLNKSCFFDVILAWRCLKENEPKNGLKELYNKYVLKGKGEPKKFSDFFPPELFPYCKPEIAGLYAANDAKITLELYEFQAKYLDKNSKWCQKKHLEKIADLTWGIEFPLISVCQNMHRTGVYLDKDISVQVRERYHNYDFEERKKLSDMIDKIMEEHKVQIISSNQKQPFRSGKDFNPKSPVHTKYLIYTVLGVPPDRDGKMSTDKSVLAELNIPVVNQILKVRSIGVLINTFVDKMPNSTTPDSRIHARFNSIGASCITGDSIIPTSNGYYTIGDICESYGCSDGEQIDVNDLTVINKDQASENSTMVVKYEDRPTIKITTEYGFTIEGTYDHPVMVSKYTYSSGVKNGSEELNNFWDGRYFKQLGNVRVGDYIEIPCNYSDQIKSEYQPSNLKLVPYKYKGKKLTARLPEIIDEEFALFLGMYHADGGARFRDGTYSIRISNDNPEVIELNRTLCKSLFNLPISVSIDKRHNGGESSVSGAQISSIDDMLSHGKQYKKIPEVIYKSPVSVINSYIKGMTLDSTVYKEQSGRLRFSITVCDYKDVRFLQGHLASQGILCSVQYERMRGGGIEHRLMFNADNYILFRDIIGFIESKKYVYDFMPCVKNGYDVRRIGNSFRVRVKKVEQSRNTVYDLHVPGTHSFISNGMISHNTGRFSSSDPNMQNLPSKATDIRHMFRATPPMDKIIECTQDESGIIVTLGRYDKVYTPDGMKIVNNLSVGDEVVLKLSTNVTSTVVLFEDVDDKPNLVCVVFSTVSGVTISNMDIQTPAYVMLSSDYSAQEPRLTAFISGDKGMIKTFQDGRDIYAGIASLSFDVPYEKCLEFHPETGEYQPDGKARRSEAKTVLLGILYGRAIPSISEQLYGKRDDMTDDEKLKAAKKVYDSVLKAFPGIKALMKHAKDFAKEHGYVETILGRRRHIPEMQLPEFEFTPMKGYINPDVDPLDITTLQNSSDIPERIKESLYKEFMSFKYFGQVAQRTKELYENDHIRVTNNKKKIQDGERECVNSIVQGSASDQTKMAMLMLVNDERWQRIGGRILIPIHDRLLPNNLS